MIYSHACTAATSNLTSRLFQGRYHEAITSYAQCIEVSPDKVVPYTNRALCFLKLKQVRYYVKVFSVQNGQYEVFFSLYQYIDGNASKPRISKMHNVQETQKLFHNRLTTE